MPAYAYEALDPKGATLKGLIDADTAARGPRPAAGSRSLVPLSVEPAMNAEGGKGSGLNMTLWGGHVFNATTLAVWTRQLAGLVAAGLPLERALAALAEEADKDATATAGGLAAQRSERRLAVCQRAGAAPQGVLTPSTPR